MKRGLKWTANQYAFDALHIAVTSSNSTTTHFSLTHFQLDLQLLFHIRVDIIMKKVHSISVNGARHVDIYQIYQIYYIFLSLYNPFYFSQTN